MSEHSIPGQDYRNYLLDGYCSGLEEDEEVVRTNSRRFRWALETLILGIVSFFAAGFLLVFETTLLVEGLYSIVVVLLLYKLGDYIHREDYLTILHEDIDHDRDFGSG
jgi:hypothetical protein